MTEDLAANFRRYGEQLAGTGQLPVYSRLSLAIAEDPRVRDLLVEAPAEQRLPVLLFAAVHHLLLGGLDHRLSGWYPTLGGRADAPGDPYEAFRDLVHTHRDQLVVLVSTRNTQTNEIGRCSVLRPAWAVVAEQVRRPLGMVELGCSAGLNLLLDRWAYAYLPKGPRYGDPDTDVLVEADSRGAPVPALGPMDIGSRVGIDLSPIAMAEEENLRWLLACVWPEQVSRFHRLRAAIEVARKDPPRLIAGDVVDSLPWAAARVADEQHLAVQNSWVLNYLARPERERLMTVLAGIGATRDLSWVSVESPEFAPDLDFPPRPDGKEDSGASVAVLSTWRAGRKAVRRLADCHPHGNWVRWW